LWLPAALLVRVQVLSRLFPFARGLCHAYWAPNAWALYSALDKVAAAVGARVGLLARGSSANMAGGIVGVSSYVVLPNVGGGTCAALVLLAMLPCLVALWRAPRQQAGAMLGPAIAYANLCGFMFGYHVHEKAALTVEVPLALAAVGGSDWGQLYVLFSTAAHVGIFPLLFTTQEVPIRWLLAVVYYVCVVWGLGSIHATQQQQQQQQTTAAAGGAGSSPQKQVGGMRTRRQLAQASGAAAGKQQQQQQQQPRAAPAAAGPKGLHEYCSWLPLAYRVYLAGFVVLELYCSLGHAALLGSRLPFVPLMLTSVYCALGFCWTWGWMAAWFVQR
jgi:alpha-1,3-glucosyltransferase